MFRFRIASVALLVGFICAADAWGHGFDVSVNSTSNPTVLSISSAQPVLDDADPTDPSNAPYPTSGPDNLFLDAFEGDPNTDGSYGTVEGFAQTAGSFPPGYTATFNILSPLYYSDGTGPAAPASSGTMLHIYDLFAGNSDGHHQGASAGDVYLQGNTSFQTGFGVSLEDAHELEKDIYLANGSTQTYGEYGFAFDVLVHFSNGPPLDTGPLYDVFALDITTDPDNPGGFATFAPFDLQDAATEAIVAALVPEPSAFVLAAIGMALVMAEGMRRRIARA